MSKKQLLKRNLKNEFICNIDWKENGDSYCIYVREKKNQFYYIQTSKNNNFHSLNNEPSYYFNSRNGKFIVKQYHEDGILHNLQGHASSEVELIDGILKKSGSFYIEGKELYPTEYKKIIKNKRKELKNILYFSNVICEDLCNEIVSFIL
jgi:hypothetical protein